MTTAPRRCTPPRRAPQPWLTSAESGGWPPKDQAVSAVCAVSAFALGTVLTEVCLYCGVPRGDVPAAAERQQLRRVVRALPEDAPDRVVETVLAVCGHDADDMFAKGLDLIVRGCEPV